MDFFHSYQSFKNNCIYITRYVCGTVELSNDPIPLVLIGFYFNHNHQIVISLYIMWRWLRGVPIDSLVFDLTSSSILVAPCVNCGRIFLHPNIFPIVSISLCVIYYIPSHDSGGLPIDLVIKIFTIYILETYLLQSYLKPISVVLLNFLVTTFLITQDSYILYWYIGSYTMESRTVLVPSNTIIQDSYLLILLSIIFPGVSINPNFKYLLLYIGDNSYLYSQGLFQ